MADDLQAALAKAKALIAKVCTCGDFEYQSIAGQRRMRILNATYVPEVGTDMWGGDSFVELCSVPKRMYRREGYTRMREAAEGA